MSSVIPASRAPRWRVAAAAVAAAAALCAAAAPPARAQGADTTTSPDDSAGRPVPGSFEVSAVVGYQWYDRAAALRDAPSLGVRIVSASPTSLSGLSFGFAGSVARPTTRGDFFPWNREIFYSDINRRNDTTLVFEVSQRVTMASYGAELGWRIGGARGTGISMPFGASVELSGGVGGYTFWLDPEQNRRNETHGGLAFTLGGGLGIPLPGNTTLRLRLDDLILTGFDREWFSLHDPLFSEELFPNPVTAPPPAKSVMHNARFTVQFGFFPGSNR